MASIAGALGRIKDDLQAYVPPQQVLDACREAGHVWRERKLGPVPTLHLFVLQLLHCNTAICALRHLTRTPLNAAAYCRARMRLPLAVLQVLLHRSAEAINQSHGGGRLWLGHRTLLLDGSSSIAPDTVASRRAFGQPAGQKPGCGFPVPKILGMIDAFTGVMLEMLIFPLYTHEARKTWTLSAGMKPGDLVIADRGFCSFVNLALLQAACVLAVLRMHQRQIVSFHPHRRHQAGKRGAGRVGRVGGRGLPTSRWVRRLGAHDQLVDWVKPKQRPTWMSRRQYDGLPESLRVRELRYTLTRKGQRTVRVTIVTTLLDERAYSRQAVADLYGVRWSVETHLGELKTTLKMRKVKCRTPAGVKKELIAYALVYNLVRAIMLQAAQRQRVAVDRISFIDALRWLQRAEPGDPPPQLLVNPHRPGRHEPRVIKDLIDSYRKMSRPRRTLRQALKRGEEVGRVK